MALIIATIAAAKEAAKTLRMFSTLEKKTVPELRAALLQAMNTGVLASVQDAENPNRFYLFTDENDRGAWITRVDAIAPKTVRDDKAIAKAWEQEHEETLADMAARWYADKYGKIPTIETGARRATVQCEHKTAKK